MTFKPATPAYQHVRDVMAYNDCNDWLDCATLGGGMTYWRVLCHGGASEYVDAYLAANSDHPVARVDFTRDVAAYMLSQCIAYAYYLDMQDAN